MSYTRFNFIIVLILLFAVATASFGAVKKKRFDFQKDSVSTEQVVEQTVVQPAVQQDEHFSPLVWITEKQKILREKVSSQIHSMKNGDANAIWMFLLVCFLYGMLHALGPGHGKSVVVGFFLARRGRWRQGVALGAGITFAHTLSAVLLLFILFGVFKTAVFPFFETGRDGIEKVSYSLLVLTGLLLVFFGVKDFLNQRKNQKKQREMLPSSATWKEILGVAAVTGVVPCPAVALIVLFCLLNSMPGMALLGAIVICIGMMVTNVAFGVVAVAFRKGIDKGSAGSKFASKIYMLASVLGGVIVLVSGVMLFHNCR